MPQPNIKYICKTFHFLVLCSLYLEHRLFDVENISLNVLYKNFELEMPLLSSVRHRHELKMILYAIYLFFVIYNFQSITLKR